MGRLYIERHLEMNRPADQVWEYMPDIRRAMTLDQFHISVDCDSADAANPRTFPHSEGWKIEEVDSKMCLATLWMRGQWRKSS